MPRKIRNHSTEYSKIDNNSLIGPPADSIWNQICERTEDHSRRLYLWAHYKYCIQRQQHPNMWESIPERVLHRHALTADMAEKLIHDFQTKGGHEPGKIAHGKTVSDTRKADIWSLETPQILKLFKDIIWEANNLHWRYQLSDIEAPQLCVYYDNTKGHYAWHRDCESPNIPYIGRRIISTSILMNDPSEFEGGDLEILQGIRPDGKPIIETVPFKNAGDACVFHSRLYHRVTPVTKGTRASMVIWCWGNDAQINSEALYNQKK